MAAMTTVLERYNTDNNFVSYLISGHTPQKPRLLQERRKPATNIVNGVYESSVKGVYGTVDGNGDYIPSKYTFEVIVRSPVNGTTTDRDALVAMMEDVITSDEMDSLVSSQSNLA